VNAVRIWAFCPPPLTAVILAGGPPTLVSEKGGVIARVPEAPGVVAVTVRYPDQRWR